MKAESHLLSRRVSYSSTPVLSAGQLALDSHVQSFNHHATDPYTLASVFAGGLAFRGVRTLGLSTLGNWVGESRLGAALLRSGVNAAGLAAESGIFVTSDRLLRVAFGNADTSLLQWGGREGLKNAWLSAAVNFTALRGAGHMTAGSNGLFQHFGAASTMVGANQLTARWGITEAPRGSLTEQFIQASVMDLQMRSGMALFHHFAPGVARWERSSDLVHEARSNSRSSLFGAELFGLGHARTPALLSMAAPEVAPVRSARAEQKAHRAAERFARDVADFTKGVTEDHRLPPEAKERILEILGDGEGRTAETLLRAKQFLNETLSKTVPDKAALKFLELRHLVPNGVSLLAGVLGISSMFAASEGHLTRAAWLLVGAAVADKMDGFVARKMKATHPIGAMLDSFVDVSCYGMASGFFVYSALSRIGFSEFAPWVATVIGMNAILRLATFDYLDTPAGKSILPPRDILRNPVQGNGKGFIGKPSTMTGPELAALWMAFGAEHPSIFLVGSILSGVAMYSPLAYAKLTDSGLGTAFRSKTFLGLSGAAIGTSIYQGDSRILAAYSLLGMGYYLFSPFITAAQRVWRNRGNPRGTAGRATPIAGDGFEMPAGLGSRSERPSAPPGAGIGE